MIFTKHTLSWMLASLFLTVPPLTVHAADVPTGIFDLFKKDDAEADPIPEEIPPKRGDNAPASAVPDSFSWYCKHTEGGQRPSMPGEMTFVRDHGGYFLGESPDEKVLYLTFDAGYENGNIARILDTLKAEDIPAAFFILENLVTKNTDLVKRMIAEGHTVCNHTTRHPDMSAKNPTEFAAELAGMEKLYRDTTGAEIAKYYRPPEGKFTRENLDCANSLGYKTIFWSYAYADWDNAKQMPADKAMKKVLDGTHNGEVLLLHPTSATNADILPELIKEWKAMGYRFGTLDELTGNRDLTKNET